jgi:hypothetical protein
MLLEGVSMMLLSLSIKTDGSGACPEPSIFAGTELGSIAVPEG